MRLNTLTLKIIVVGDEESDPSELKFANDVDLEC